MPPRDIRLSWLLLALALFFTGCSDPCSRLLETVCKDLPDEHHCRNYREKVSNGEISSEMCAATRRAYVASLEKESQ